MSAAQLWIIDDDRAMRFVLQKTFEEAGFAVQSFGDGLDILNRLEHEQPDTILSDIRMPGLNGLVLMEQIKARWPDLPVIIMTAHSDLDSAVASYQSGAFDYLPKPFDLDEAVALVRRAIAQHPKSAAKPTATSSPEPGSRLDLIGESPAMQDMFRAIGRLAHSHITVLINGESGTGKELVAHALHKHSPRRDQPFIALNMAAIPHDLIESELFGHEKGAFTGASAQRQGRFEQARGGTLFLDEIGDMPFEAQTRLLRVLSNGEFYRIGGQTPVKADVRIIAATHQNLEQLVKDGRFREDLFHRLNVIRLHIPRLADRSGDIEKLAQHFLQQAARELGVEARLLTPEALTVLQQFDWPGNVRQLENLCRWLTVMSVSRDIHPEDLPPEFLSGSPVPLRPPVTPLSAPAVSTASPEPSSASTTPAWTTALAQWARAQLLQHPEAALLDEALPQFERTLMEVALQHCHGHKQNAALKLGWGRNTLTRKLQELGLEAAHEH